MKKSFIFFAAGLSALFFSCRQQAKIKSEETELKLSSLKICGVFPDKKEIFNVEDTDKIGSSDIEAYFLLNGNIKKIKVETGVIFLQENKITEIVLNVPSKSGVYREWSGTAKVRILKDDMVKFDFEGKIEFPFFYNDLKIGSVEQPYKIGKYEVTYKLWKEVYDWAVSSESGEVYSFSNPGRKGSLYPGFKENVNGSDLQPVCFISFRDMIVWCNAYSEKNGKTPVYYSDEACTIPLRKSTTEVFNGEKGSQDMPYEKKGGGGYRLPTQEEWEFAARLAKQNNNVTGTRSAVVNGEQWFFTKGMTASGVTGVFPCALIDDVCWYDNNSAIDGSNQTHPVAERRPNAAGCYDMSGNIYELVSDWSSFTETLKSRYAKGGSFNSLTIGVQIGSYNGLNAEDALPAIGFRLAATIVK